jgi:hypothetical protein
LRSFDLYRVALALPVQNVSAAEQCLLGVRSPVVLFLFLAVYNLDPRSPLFALPVLFQSVYLVPVPLRAVLFLALAAALVDLETAGLVFLVTATASLALAVAYSVLDRPVSFLAAQSAALCLLHS